MPTAPPGEADLPLHVSTQGDATVLALGSLLDAAAGAALLLAAHTAARTGVARIDIDLRALLTFTDEGAASLVACRDLAAELPEGLHYRTGRGPGRDALLAAYSI
jgi:hypothetical protein